MFVPWDQKREKLARQAIDRDPIPHFPKYDQRNLTAANARRAELRREEERRLVTPPEELPNWKWFDPRRRVKWRSLTLGDPSIERSALSGWKNIGEGWTDAGHVDCNRGVAHRKCCSERGVPSMPSLVGYPQLRGWKMELCASALAVLTLRGCRFPIGDVGSKDFHFCNERRHGWSSYCARHAEFCEKRL